MKKNIFVALAAAVVLLFSSCSKDIDLAGTTWKSNTYSNTLTYMGMSMGFTMDLTINFTDATNYTLNTTATASVMGQTQNFNDSSTGTYTYDDGEGMFDGEQSFTYDKKTKTITTAVPVGNDEIAALLGESEITFTFTQQ